MIFGLYPDMDFDIVNIVLFCVCGIGIVFVAISLCWLFKICMILRNRERQNMGSGENSSGSSGRANNSMVRRRIIQKLTYSLRRISFRRSKSFVHLMNKQQENLCSICLEKFTSKTDDADKDIIGLLSKCGHIFHFDCIWRWIEHNSSCPICRTSTDISTKSIKALSIRIIIDIFNARAKGEDDAESCSTKSGGDDSSEKEGVINSNPAGGATSASAGLHVTTVPSTAGAHHTGPQLSGPDWSVVDDSGTMNSANASDVNPYIFTPSRYNRLPRSNSNGNNPTVVSIFNPNSSNIFTVSGSMESRSHRDFEWVPIEPQNPNPNTNQNPLHDPSHNPNQNQGQNPGQNPGHNPGPNPGQNSNQNTGQNPTQGSPSNTNG